MSADRKWSLLSIVSLGIGISTIFIAGRSLARAALRWQFSKKSNAVQTRLKEKLENPLTETTIVTRISEWDEVYSVLSKYNNYLCSCKACNSYCCYIKIFYLTETFQKSQFWGSTVNGQMLMATLNLLL